MSADLALTWPDAPECARSAHWPDEVFPIRRPWTVEPHTFNVTYNLTPMFMEAGMPAWEHFEGMRASVAAGVITKVISELLSDPDRYKAYEPENKWGDYEGAVAFLRGMRDCLDDHPEAILRTWL